jgi:hypothetical protein
MAEHDIDPGPPAAGHAGQLATPPGMHLRSGRRVPLDALADPLTGSEDALPSYELESFAALSRAVERGELPTDQRRVLDRTESDLEGGEQRLRSMFVIFTRLTRAKGAPRTESLQPRADQGRYADVPGPAWTAVIVRVGTGLVQVWDVLAR